MAFLVSGFAPIEQFIFGTPQQPTRVGNSIGAFINSAVYNENQPENFHPYAVMGVSLILALGVLRGANWIADRRPLRHCRAEIKDVSRLAIAASVLMIWKMAIEGIKASWTPNQGANNQEGATE